jgi:uncharacterized membrane protein
MSDLIAVAYPDRDTAEAVRRTLGQLALEHVIELDDAVVVTRDDKGRVKLHQAVRPGAAGAANGALWGGLIGLLFLAPLFGMALGAAAGGASGALVDYGVNDSFMKELGQQLAPGSSAVIVLVHEVTPDKVLPRIEKFGGKVMHTSLDEQTEQRLQEALGAPQEASATA